MFLAVKGSHLPVGVVVDDGREDLPLVQLEVGRDEVEDDPVASVRLDAVLQLLVVQAEEGVSRGDPEQQLVPETGKEIIISSCAVLSMSGQGSRCSTAQVARLLSLLYPISSASFIKVP